MSAARPCQPKWIEEVERRAREIDDGTVETIPADEVLREALDPPGSPSWLPGLLLHPGRPRDSIENIWIDVLEGLAGKRVPLA